MIGKLSSRALSEKFRKTGFDCDKEASWFPYAAKMKMSGRKIKPSEVRIILASVDTAIAAYLLLAIHTLRKHYLFSWVDIYQWWNKCKEVGELYSRGMTDDFIVTFMKEECDLEIVR